jgi:hypothetical protein
MEHSPYANYSFAEVFKGAAISMTDIITPGVLFDLELAPSEPSSRLARTPSTYEYGASLETRPVKGEAYVMCADGSIQSKWFPEKPIGWELVKMPGTLFGTGWRVTQVGFEPEECSPSILGRAEEIPEGRGKIGSQIFKAYAT